MYEKANLLDIATTQYLELEDAYKKHGASEQKTNSKDRCFSAYFSSGSDSKLVIGKKYDKDIGSHFQDTKRKLGNARITRFDFHQYVVSKIIRLYFNQELYEQGLKKATLFINDSYKMMTRNKDVSPIFVQAWAYSASFSVADFCTKKIYSSLEETLKQQMSKDAESISSSSGGGGGGSKALSKSTDSGQTQAQAAASISKKDVLDFAFADSSKRGAFVLVSNLLFISKRQLKRLGYIRKLIPTHVFYEELREVSRTVGIDLDEKVSESPNPMDSLEQDLSGLSELDETASDVPAIVPEFGGNDPVDDDSVEAPILVVPTPEHRALTVKKISEPSSDSETSNDVQETAPAAAAVIVPKTAEPTVTSEPQKQQKENEVQNETAEPEQKKKEESDSAQQSKECDTEPELQAQSTTETLTTTTASSTDNEVKEPDQKNDGNSSVKQEENKEKEKEESQGSEASEVSKPEDAQKEDAPRKERISLDVQRDTPSIRISTEIPSRIAKSMLIKPEKTLSCAPSLEASQKASYSLMASPKIAGEAVFDFPRRSSPDPYRASILSMSSSKKSTKKTHRRTKTGSCISITTQKKKEPSEFVSNMYNDDFTQDFNGKEVSGENIEEFERNVDDEVLMKSLRTPEDFDALLEDITRKSELAFDIAKRTRSAISSECDLAFHYL